MIVEALPYLVAGAAAGGFINGLAGFGTALFALGFFLSVMTPVEGVAVVLFLSVVSGLQGVWLVRQAMLDNTRRLARFLVPALVGILPGVLVLSMIDAGTLKLVIAGFLILYGGYFSARRALPAIERRTPIVDMTIGFAGGVLGGAAGLSGALPTMWCSMRDWPKAETRAVLQPFNVVVLGVAMVILAVRGDYTGRTVAFCAVALPVAVLMAQVGIVVFKRLEDTQFRRLLIAMTFVSGAVLLVRELL